MSETLTVRRMQDMTGGLRLRAGLLLVAEKGCDKMPYTFCETGPGMCQSCIASLALREVAESAVPQRGERPCTCPWDDRPATCQHKYALRECLVAESAADSSRQRGATFFCQNAGYMCECCGQHKHSPTLECMVPQRGVK